MQKMIRSQLRSGNSYEGNYLAKSLVNFCLNFSSGWQKVLLLLMLCLLPLFGLQAQSTANYTFSTATTGSLALDKNGNAVDMSTGTTQLFAASQDQVASAVTNIGFPFYLMGVSYTQFSASSNGMIGLGGTAVSGSEYYVGATTTPRIAAFSGDLKTGPAGKVHYKIIGTAPDRVLVVEFKNMSILYTPNTNDGTYQARLYENGSVIEFVYGSMFRNSGLTGSSTTIGFSVNTTANKMFTINTTTQTASTASQIKNVYPISAVITALNSASDGLRRIYSFTPPATPVAPSGLTLSSIGASRMTLNWIDNSNNELGFAIYRSTDGTNFTQVATTAADATNYPATGLIPSTLYYWKVAAFNEGQINLSAMAQATTSTASTYTWKGGTNGAWGTPANWDDGSGGGRNNPDATDVLQFDPTLNSGISNITVTGVPSPSQTIAQLILSNATVDLQSSASATLTIAGGNGVDLIIPSGSVLSLNSTNSLSLGFSAGGSGTIDGTLTLGGTTNTFDATNATGTGNCTVSGTGVINNGGVITATTNLKLNSGATYNHTRDGGTVPALTYDVNSTINIKGTAATATTFAATSVGNLMIESTVPVTRSIALPVNLTVNGDLNQDGGTLTLGSGTLTLMKALIQSTGVVINNSGAGSPNIAFKGTGSSAQDVTFSAIGVTNKVNYLIYNTGGINLTGTMRVNNGATLTVTNAGTAFSGGAVVYTGTATLVYNSTTGPQTATAVEFPTLNGPTNLTISNVVHATLAPYGSNAVTLTGGDRSLAGKVKFTAGFLKLGSNNITLETAGGIVNGEYSGSPPGSGAACFIQDGSGRLKRVIPVLSALTTFYFPIAVMNGSTVEYGGGSLDFTANNTQRTITLKVSSGADPNSGAHPNLTSNGPQTDYINRYWSFDDDKAGIGTYTYSAGFRSLAADFIGTKTNIHINRWDRANSGWSEVAGTLDFGNAAQPLFKLTAGNETSCPLGGSDFTGRVNPFTEYTWNGSVSTDYSVANNWTPSRTFPSDYDRLKFNIGGSITVTNVPTQNIGQLLVSKNTLSNINTDVNLQPASTAILTILGLDGADLNVEAGSSLTLAGAGANSMSLAFSGTGTNDVAISGTLNINSNNTLSNTINLANTITTVAATGVVNNAGTVSGATASTLLLAAGATYNHNRDGGTLPTATYDPASNVIVTGVISTIPVIGTLLPGNFTWNSPSQTLVNANAGLSSSTIQGNFKVLSTGSGSLVLGNGPEITVNGNLEIQGGTMIISNATNNSGWLRVKGNVIQSGGTLDLSSNTNSTATDLFLQGDLIQSVGVITKSGGGTGLSTIKFEGTNNQAVTLLANGVTNVINYLLTNPAGITLSGTLPVNNNSTIDLGTNQISGTGSIIINGKLKTKRVEGLSGSANTALTNSVTITPGPGSTIEYNGAGAQTISARPDYQILLISGARGGAGLTLEPGIIGVAQTFNPAATNGTWTTNGNTVDFNGTAAQTIPVFSYNNLTSSSSGSRTIAGTVKIAGSFIPGTNAYTVTGSTVEFNGTAAQTIPAFSFNNLTSSSTGTRTIAGTVQIADTFTPGTNAYTVMGSTVEFNGIVAQTIPAFSYNNLTSSSSGARTVSGTVKVAGSFLPGTNAYTVTGSTVEFNGTGNQSIPAFNYNNLISSSTGARTISGTVKISEAFTPGTNTYSVTGSTIEFNGTAAQTIPAFPVVSGSNYHNLIVSNQTPVTLSANISLSGTATVNSGSTLDLGVNKISGTGNVAINGTMKTAKTEGFSGTANTALANTLTGITLGSGSTIEYNGTGAQTITTRPDYQNLIISGARGGAAVTLAPGTIQIAQAFNPTATAATWTTTNNIIEFTGTTQYVPAFAFNSLKVSGSDTKTLLGNINVAGTLTMNGGQLQTNSNKVIMGTNALLVETDATYITGTVETTANMIATNLFTLNGIGLSLDVKNSQNLPGATTVRRVTGTPVSSSNGNHGIARYFEIVPTNNQNLKVDMAFTYHTHELNGILENNLELFKAATTNGPWLAQGFKTQNAATNTVTLTNISGFSIWTLGDQSAPLPVEMVAFNAKKVGTNVEVTWATASEKNSQGFEVQVSANGSEYHNLGFVESHNSSNMQQYQFTDLENGKTGIRYYRLKQIDLDGTVTYYGPKTVRFDAEKLQVSAYPNPFDQEINLKISAVETGIITLKLTDLTGKVILTRKANTLKGNNQLNLGITEHLPAGVYLLQAQIGAEQFTTRLLKK